MTFFWMSIAIFIMCNMAYSMLFVGMFVHKHEFLAWWLFLPFGELCPLIVWS